MPEIVGRERELEALRDFLDRRQGGPAALVLEGEAGIGKSTLWSAGVAHATANGLRVLAARPAEAEQGLAHAGLRDLFEDALDDLLPELSPPRRRALEIALLIEEYPEDRLDRHALGVAVRDIVRLLAGEEPVVVAVDDGQWLDASSAAALAFALRRIVDLDVLLLVARRVGPDSRTHLPERAVSSDRIRRLPVGPLGIGALNSFLRRRLGRPFARQTLVSLHERSGGNPLFALELARALDDGADPLRPLPVPVDLDELLRARVGDLPSETREALALAAALGPSSPILLERVGISAEALEPAFAGGVIEGDDRAIRFSHPLLSSIIYHDLEGGRLGVHARLADLVEDPLQRARHRALSLAGPNADVAAELDSAASLASARGLTAVAAELAEHALRLTPPEGNEESHRRALVAARAHHSAGEWTRAQALLGDLLTEVEHGPLRAEALIVLAELEPLERSVGLLEEALRDAESNLALEAIVQCRLAWVGRFDDGIGHARAAEELASRLGDETLGDHARAVGRVLGWFRADEPAPDDLAAWTHDFAAAVGGDQMVQEATLAVVNTLAPASKRETARAFFEQEYREWGERDEPRGARALWGLAWVEFWAGRWELAAAHAERAYDVSIQYGLERPQDHLPIALVAVHRGDLELARTHSERALRLAEEQFTVRPPQHQAILGLAALWDGDRAAAAEWLRGAERQALELSWREPSLRWWTADYAELLLEDGRLDEAESVVGAWASDADRVGREYVAAQALRCRGLVAAARGDLEQGASLLAEAVVRHGAVGDPFGRARALLALGVVRRRARQKRSARDAIEQALAGFVELGAQTWAARARRELGSIGGRTREAGLTAAERRVAALVVEGRTNREVAAALYLGERTVASHLTHIYAKLGVRSRAELTRVLR